MKYLKLVLIAVLVGISYQQASAEQIPDWVKNNAKWWSEGTIGDADFVNGIQFLISENIIEIPQTSQGKTSSSEIPDWVKNNAKWWSEGTIGDADFVNGIQFLIKNGIMQVQSTATSAQPLEQKMEECKKKATQREQYECERETKAKHELEKFKAQSTSYQVGPITFHYAGATVETSGGTDIVNVKLLAENTGSAENITLFCTGPSACNYDLSDGTTTYKYSAQDFTSGQVVLKAGQSKFVNMLFGPAIGYGSYIDFEFDPSREYFFNVKEPWGTASIPLGLS